MPDGYIELPDWLQPPSGSRSRDVVAPALKLPDGRRVEITGPTLLGRDPQPRPGEAGAALVSTGADRSVSKTHALVEPSTPDTVVLTDRRSTNGTAVLAVDGARRVIPSATPTIVRRGERIVLGELELLLD